MKTFRDYAAEIVRFFREEKGMALDPAPKISVDLSERDPFDPFVPTGHYDFRKNEITLHAGGRQCKDVLRTLCHELVHAQQYLDDPEGFARTDKAGPLAANPELREYERQAYELGNLYFRDWTEREAGA